MGWRSLVVMGLVGFAAAGCSVTITRENAAPPTVAAPEGFRTVRNARAGVSLAIPDAWLVLDLSDQSLSAALEAIGTKHANIVDFFSGDTSENDPSLRFTDMFAIDSAAKGGQPDNLRLEHYESGPITIDGVRTGLGDLGFTDIVAKAAKVGGHDGIEATGHAEAGGASALADLFVTRSDDVAFVFQFVVDDTASDKELVDEVMATARLR
jgi:hypothetical protein